jgi:CRISPR/Cas system endoribonuclease Cas6 (RAMP superfamily)
MLLSILIHLEAQAESQLDQFTGRGVHGFWFNRWREVDAALGDALHDSTDMQSFTLSPLMGLPRSYRGAVHLKPGIPAHFRIATLTNALSEAVQSKWLDGLEGMDGVCIPEPKDEDPGIPWRVTRVEVERQESYEALSKVHLMNSVPPREWRLDFFSPTTFHGSNGHLPFPLPDSLVNSWMRRWNAFAPIALPKEELLEWSRQKLVVSSYHLRTSPAREGERLRVGCVGSLTLRALEMPPYLRAAIDLLSHYSLFCGSGSHTAQGMGQTNLLSAR